MSIDPLALLLALSFTAFCFLLQRWARRFELPHLKFSSLKLLRIDSTETGRPSEDWAYRFFFAAFVLFLIAFVDPHYYSPKTDSSSSVAQAQTPVEGIAMYLVLDKSGSMSEPVQAGAVPGPSTLSKIDLLKSLTKEFVKGRANDLIGLVSFARGAQVDVPLTLDHEAVLSALKSLNAVTEDTEDGTAIGYAIYKTTALIEATRHYAEDLIGKGKPAYEIKSYALIVVTDGFQDPSPLDKGNRWRNIELVDAAEAARKQGIHVYVVSIDPLLNTEKYALNRKLMRQIAELTGGKFFQVDQNLNLAKIYAEIDRLEKSEIFSPEEASIPKSHQPHLYRRVSFAPYLIGCGMCLLLVGVFMETLWRRKVP